MYLSAISALYFNMKTAITLLFMLNVGLLFPQSSGEKKSTLVVKKKVESLKARYEESAHMLIAVDKYGNVFDTSIVSYKVTFRMNGETKTVVLINKNDLFHIRKTDPGTEVKFENILFRKENGTIIELPSFSMISPRESQEKAKKR